MVIDFPETKEQALKELNKKLSGSKIPNIRRQKPKWLLKHLSSEHTNKYEEIKELCEHIVHRGWS